MSRSLHTSLSGSKLRQEERLRKREDVVEGKERSIFVRIDEAEKRRQGNR